MDLYEYLVGMQKYYGLSVIHLHRMGTHMSIEIDGPQYNNKNVLLDLFELKHQGLIEVVRARQSGWDVRLKTAREIANV